MCPISAYAFKGRVAALRLPPQEGKVRLLFCEDSWEEPGLRQPVPKVFNGLQIPVASPAGKRPRPLKAERADPYVRDDPSLKKRSRDADDEIFLRLALGAQADALVTGDRDLLELEGHYPFLILTPADFKARFFLTLRLAKN